MIHRSKEPSDWNILSDLWQTAVMVSHAKDSPEISTVPLRPHSPAKNPVVTAHSLTKIYGSGDNGVVALNDIFVSIARARFTAIMGPSGSGKSTLMHCLAGLESATSGSINLDGQEITSMNERQLTRLRRERIGFIFQSFNLLPSLTVEENITLPIDIARKSVDFRHLSQIVKAVGLSNRLSHRPAELSGGQVQRTACARSFMGRPSVIFADEPTGNLDSRATMQILQILRSSVDHFGQSVVMVTHEPEAAACADTVLFLRDGRLAAQLDKPDRDSVLIALHALSSSIAMEVPEFHSKHRIYNTSKTTLGVSL
mgnify:FL=1|jgi:ABC transporter related protein